MATTKTCEKWCEKFKNSNSKPDLKVKLSNLEKNTMYIIMRNTIKDRLQELSIIDYNTDITLDK